VRAWQNLRAWKKRQHVIRRRDCYRATSLLSGLNEGRLRVTILPATLNFLAKHPPTNYKGEPGRPKHRHGFLASLVMLACLTRRAPAVLGKLDDFGALMGVSRRTAWADLEYLCSIGLLVKLSDFKVGKSYGRDGEPIDHRQLANWYQPGPQLRAIWAAFEAEQAQKAAKWEERFPSSVPSVPTVHKSTTAAKWSDSSSTPDTGEGARRCGTWRANMGLEAGTPNEPPKSPRAGESDFQRQIRESRERGSTECKIYDPSLRSKKSKLRSSTSTTLPKPSTATQTGYAGPASKGKIPTPAAQKNVAARPMSAADDALLKAAESAGVEPEVLRGLYRLFPDVAVSLARNHPKNASRPG
jgi:hypothetical protein